ncbi:MAG TPA: hypothetical protein VNO50_05050 [Pyrinomonadaceae bacterium]|nr:hypothetical protein [Pyrinomonadaceae bacterium]
MIANGVVVSKKLVEAARRGPQFGQEGLEQPLPPASLRSADDSEFARSPFSVTEQTTKHLRGSGEK